MKVNVPLEIGAPVIRIEMPPTMPLMCDGAEAGRLFGLSAGTLKKLERTHRDFPVKRIGGAVRYMVPELYAWMRDYPGDIPTE